MLPREIVSTIIPYGGYLETLELLKKIIVSKDSTSLILRGDNGCGKKTVVQEAISKNDILIRLHPALCSEDISTLRLIASTLGLKKNSSLQETMEDIEERCGTSKKKIVIVLENFEEFCRQKQSLLYCLTNLTQHGHNITLIGLTVNLDPTEHLEKRVRSRLNTLFQSMPYPYRNKKEYLEFASLLLGGYKIQKELESKLEIIYHLKSRSIRYLKRFLTQMIFEETCTKPKRSYLDPDHRLIMLDNRLKALTRASLELLKLAAYYCFACEEKVTFTLEDLQQCASNIGYKNFDATSIHALESVNQLIKLSFFKPLKPKLSIGKQSVMAISGFTQPEFKNVMQNNTELHLIKSDHLWKTLK